MNMSKIVSCYMLIIALFPTSQLFSQIVLTSNINPVPGDLKNTVSCDTTGIVQGNPGANQTWNFTSISRVDSTDTTGCIAYRWIAASATPYAGQFPTSNLAKTNDNSNYFYYTTSSVNWFENGFAGPDNFILYTDPELFMQYPFSYNSTFTDDFSADFILAGVPVRETGTITVTGDAWGTISLPSGTYPNALRVKYVISQRDSLNPGIPTDVVSNITSYVWFVPGRRFHIFEITYSDKSNNGIPLYSSKSVILDTSRTLSGIPPNTPMLASPTDGAQGVSVPPVFNWTGVSGATSYQLQLSTNALFTTTVIDKSGLTSNSYTASGLINNTMYYWRVNATNTDGTSSWSNVWNFTTAATPPALPILVSPANGATGIPTNTTLNWNTSSGAISYRLQVSNISTFPTTVLDTILSTTSKTISGLTNNMTYYWRVNATSTGGTSAWSAVWNFMTVVAPPLIPIALSPLDGTLGVAISPTISWNAANGATTYRLQVSTSSSFTTTICDTNVNTLSFAAQGLSYNTIYYWHINASNAGGTSNWSTVFRFTTVLSTPVEQLSNAAPTKYLLFQNYPNPFNSNTKIEFGLPAGTHTSLKVFDILGKEILELVNEELPAGNYTNTLEAGSLQPGMYFYRLQAGSFTQTKKLILAH